MNNTAFILIGSNIEPFHNIRESIDLLSQYFHITNISKIYQSKPIRKNDVNEYLNAAVEVQTDLPPKEVKFDVLRKIEDKMGRVRTEDKYKPRKIDLDLVLWNNEIIQDEENDIFLPDPEIIKYSHIAVPLAEIAPNYKHPQLGITLENIAEQFVSDQELRIFAHSI